MLSNLGGRYASPCPLSRYIVETAAILSSRIILIRLDVDNNMSFQMFHLFL